MKILYKLTYIFSFLFLLSFYSNSNAQTVVIEGVETTLVSENVTIVPGEEFYVGLKFTMQGEWHTYWNNPGDTGLPAIFKWDLPEGFKVSDIIWPTPHKIFIEPLINYGYKGETILMAKITPPANLVENDIYNIKLKADYLICEEICIPGSGEYSTQVIGSGETTYRVDHKPLFDKIRSELPQEILTDFKVYSDNDSYYIGIPTNQTPALPLTFIPANEDVIIDSADQDIYKTESEYIITILKDTYTGNENKPRLQGLLLSGSGEQETAYTFDVAVSNDAPPAPPMGELFNTNSTNSLTSSDTYSSSVNTFIIAIWFAFIAGLILNLMPCVLPVLSLKVVHMIEQAHNKKALKHGAVFTMGVLTTFWAMAVTLIALKSSGEALGWGFQLQSPVFVSLLALFLVLIALDFFGVFEIGTSMTQLENTIKDKRGYSESFMSGILITIVATPCTVPFMGGAVTFALTKGAIEMVTIFTAMGIGLASPYLLFTAFPKFMHFLPKPGRWMVTFKQLMGFPVLATAIWLVWVYSKQTDIDALFTLVTGLFVVSFGAWIYGRFGHIGAHNFTRVIALLVFLTSLLFAAFSGITSDEKPIELKWGKWSPEAVEGSLELGTPVFVNFTADWCVTCKFNEKLTLSSPKVHKTLELNNVALYKADWTTYDKEITQALDKFGRKGVPLYVVYPLGQPENPIILPQLLTEEIITSLFEK